jgi:hypothetical protein
LFNERVGCFSRGDKSRRSTVEETPLRISRDQHVWSFDAQREPVLVVDPGAVIEVETWDCFTGQVQSESDTPEKLDLTGSTVPRAPSRCAALSRATPCR